MTLQVDYLMISENQISEFSKTYFQSLREKLRLDESREERTLVRVLFHIISCDPGFFKDISRFWNRVEEEEQLMILNKDEKTVEHCFWCC